jgi:hypothetical protein
MAIEMSQFAVTRQAGADLSAKQFYFVEQASTGKVTVCNSLGEKALGVVQNNPGLNQAANVATNGVCKVIAGGTLVPGDLVNVSAAGKAVAASSTYFIMGEVLVGGGDGEIVTILLRPVAQSGTVIVTQDSSLQSATVTITTAELLALNATPKELLPAPGSGYANVVDSAVLFLDYNSAAYNGVASGEDLEIRYTNGSGQLVATVETTGFLDQASDQVRYVQVGAVTAITPVANAAVVLDLASGEIATGNSPLKVKIYYRVVPTAL